MIQKLKELSKENLEQTILEIAEVLSKAQYQQLEEIIEKCRSESQELESAKMPVRMS